MYALCVANTEGGVLSTGTECRHRVLTGAAAYPFSIIPEVDAQSNLHELLSRPLTQHRGPHPHHHPVVHRQNEVASGGCCSNPTTEPAEAALGPWLR